MTYMQRNSNLKFVYVCALTRSRTHEYSEWTSIGIGLYTTARIWRFNRQKLFNNTISGIINLSVIKSSLQKTWHTSNQHLGFKGERIETGYSELFSVHNMNHIYIQYSETDTTSWQKKIIRRAKCFMNSSIS